MLASNIRNLNWYKQRYDFMPCISLMKNIVHILKQGTFELCNEINDDVILMLIRLRCFQELEKMIFSVFDLLDG